MLPVQAAVVSAEATVTGTSMLLAPSTSVTPGADDLLGRQPEVKRKPGVLGLLGNGES